MMAFATLVLVLLMLIGVLLFKTPRMKTPPGPLAFPIVGHLHLLLGLPHQAFHRLSMKYGPIMSIKLGRRDVVVVSSEESAKKVLTTHDKLFASRPPLISPQHLCYGAKDIACASFSPEWINLKKLCIRELFSSKHLEETTFKQARQDHLRVLMDNIGSTGDLVQVKEVLSTYTMAIVSTLLFGKPIHRFEGVVLEAVELMGAVHIGDYIPTLAWIDYAGFLPRLRRTHLQLDRTLQHLLNTHRLEGSSCSLINKFSSAGIDDDTTKAVILDILAGGTDTTSLTIEWALAELLKNPVYILQIENELKQEVGQRHVEEDDLPRLKFLKAVVKETFRLHPATPLLVPHYAMEDSHLDGYRVSKGSWVIVNVWSIGRTGWNSPDEFRPERFLDLSIDLDKGTNFRLIPFGAGRRKCLGMSLALRTIEITLASLVQAFNWTLPRNKPVDMLERQGVVTQRKTPLLAFATWKLTNNNAVRHSIGRTQT